MEAAAARLVSYYRWAVKKLSFYGHTFPPAVLLPLHPLLPTHDLINLVYPFFRRRRRHKAAKMFSLPLLQPTNRRFPKLFLRILFFFSLSLSLFIREVVRSPFSATAHFSPFRLSFLPFALSFRVMTPGKAGFADFPRPFSAPATEKFQLLANSILCGC